MTITVPLTAEEEAKLTELANGRGLSPDALVQSLVKEVIDRNTFAASNEKDLGPQEREKQIEELFEFFDRQEVPAEVNEAAFHRENWYR